MSITLKQFFSRFTSDAFPPPYVFAALESGEVVSIDIKDIPDVIKKYTLGGTTTPQEGSLPILCPM